MVKKALYLAGGGARGAYQAGVLKAIGHILQTKTLPFDMVSGVSVGSINAAILAENADDFPLALDKLESIWGEIHCQQIYKASNYELGKSVMRNLSTLIIKQRQSGHLLDTSPLKQFIDETIDFSRIEQNINAGYLNTLEVISLCYETHQTISFYNHNHSEFQDWNYPRHGSQRANISAEHILASSALPLFFPTITVDGFHYGDGSIGLVAPLRGAIRFEVDKILILGTRELPEFTDSEMLRNGEVPFASILGNMLNGLFLDNLDRDIEMVNRMNEIATLLSMWKKRRSPWRPISTLHLRPSRDMAFLAQNHYKTMSALLRYLLNILGAKSHSGDLLSFLLFEKEFTRELLELGFQDTIANAKEVTAFFA
ncbi:patatin-like phospholipase family protein [Legionella sp. EUR-108]|uniref:Patatin-like phospholipase family protein n=2 Tax=Legionella maioricensis TaxID=2896528 RepID=A0A9X2D0U3_9GAMM|nr:patatin-like phospholipase family protein [Legionella maioricensis]MCL9683787.1 patatin-like phospholipase family protein [Legionella maioricensis]MCL9686634.1 patatin-like phospholipase family protein [Legionella maioricensis]